MRPAPTKVSREPLAGSVPHRICGPSRDSPPMRHRRPPRNRPFPRRLAREVPVCRGRRAPLPAQQISLRSSSPAPRLRSCRIPAHNGAIYVRKWGNANSSPVAKTTTFGCRTGSTSTTSGRASATAAAGVSRRTFFNSVSPFARFPDLKRIWCSGPKPSANRARWPFTPRVFMRDNAVRAFGNIDSGKDAHRFRLDNVTIEGRAQGCLPHQHAALAKPGFGQTHGVSIYRLSSHAGCRWRPVPAWPDTGVRRSLLTRFRWGEQLPLRVAGRWLRHG
jgi:hypothetical protein